MLIVAWCASAFVGAVAGQSLADVARAEAERRKTITQPSRVYTNTDLKPVRPSDASPPDAERDGAQQVPLRAPHEKPDAASPSAGRRTEGGTSDEDEACRNEEEQRWRRRMAEARDQVERSRTFAEALQSRINALTADFSARDDPAQRGEIGTQLNKSLAELERVRGDIEAQQKAVADLEEEARRANVPPGWLR